MNKVKEIHSTATCSSESLMLYKERNDHFDCDKSMFFFICLRTVQSEQQATTTTRK